MTAGYDQRKRQREPLKFRWFDSNGVLQHSGSSPQLSESVTSYRSDVRGTRLDPRQVDLYGGFLQRREGGLAEYLNPGPRLLAELEASGLASRSDHESLTGLGIDNGHPFEMSSQRMQTSLRRDVRYRPNGNGYPVSYRCVGNPVFISDLPVGSSAISRMPFEFGSLPSAPQYKTSFTGLAQSPPDSKKLQSDGTQLLTSLAPASPKVSVTGAFLELALGLPQIPLHTLNKLSVGGVGDEYLNAVFGIMPTYDDAVNIAKTLRDVSLKIQQIRRDEGRRIRRRGKLPVQSKAEIFQDSELGIPRIWAGRGIDPLTSWTKTGTPQGDMLVYGAQGQQDMPYNKQLFMSQTRYVTFSGSFTYVLPEIPGFTGRLEKYLSAMDALLGLSLSSKTAWQITPWSWLIDWFLDIRQNIAAIQVAHDDNHVVNYAYAMETVERKAVAKVQWTQVSPLEGATYVSTSVNSVFKRRIRANPYGFVNEADSGAWGPYRLAILAALGISRA